MMAEVFIIFPLGNVISMSIVNLLSFLESVLMRYDVVLIFIFC